MSVKQLIERFGRQFRVSAEAGDASVAAAPTIPIREVVRRFWPDARPYRKWLAPILLFVALGPALETATIWLYKLVVDEVLVPRDFAPFPGIALAYVGLTLLSGLIAFGDDTLSAWVSGRFLLRLRTRVFAHVQRLPLDFFDRKARGDLVTRITGDVADIDTLLVSGPADFLAYAMQIAFFTGMLFYLNWQLALLALVVSPLFWWASEVSSGRITALAREQRRRSGATSAVAEESLANAQLVQAYNQQQSEVDRFERETLGNFAATMAVTRLRALLAPLLDLFELASMLLVLGAGAWQLTAGSLTLGGLLVFITYLGQLYAPVRGLSRLVSSAAAATAGAERVIEILDQEPAVREPVTPAEQPRLRGAVAFEAVDYRYPRGHEDALSRVSFRVEPGETVALVGASGAGKSSILRLLLRFADPSGGRITIDGHDTRDLDLHGLRERTAVVLQDALIMSGTIRENIAFGRPGATDQEVETAAVAADAAAFIAALPQGYDTPLGQGGARLSGGQRQRLAIARAMIRDAPILLLDEPTTGLDAASGDRIMAPLRRLMGGRTTIIVSHNLLTVREANEILVLDAGRIVERGRHAELLARGGAYARLYQLHQPEGDLGLEPEPEHATLLGAVLRPERPRSRGDLAKVQ